MSQKTSIIVESSVCGIIAFTSDVLTRTVLHGKNDGMKKKSRPTSIPLFGRHRTRHWLQSIVIKIPHNMYIWNEGTMQKHLEATRFCVGGVFLEGTIVLPILKQTILTFQEIKPLKCRSMQSSDINFFSTCFLVRDVRFCTARSRDERALQRDCTTSTSQMSHPLG